MKLNFIKNRLDNQALSGYSVNLSQNELAVTPNCQNWLFLRPNTALGANFGANLPFANLATSKRYSLMVWLILQNKPFGEYVERLLIQPRVRPHHPIVRVFTQNELGVFPMNTHITGNHAIITIPLSLYYVLCFVGFVAFAVLHIALFWVFVALGGVL